MKIVRVEMRREVKAAEQDALEILVDGLERQRISEVVSRYEKSRNIVANVINPLTKKSRSGPERSSEYSSASSGKSDYLLPFRVGSDFGYRTPCNSCSK